MPLLTRGLLTRMSFNEQTAIVLNRSQIAKLRVVHLLCYHPRFNYAGGRANHDFENALRAVPGCEPCSGTDRRGRFGRVRRADVSRRGSISMLEKLALRSYFVSSHSRTC